MQEGTTPSAPAAKAVFRDGARLGSIVERELAFVALDAWAQEIGVFRSERQAAQAIFSHARRRQFAEAAE